VPGTGKAEGSFLDVNNPVNRCHKQAGAIDLKSQGIGILSLIGDKVLLAYQAAAHPLPGTESIKIYYHAVPEWQVKSEINNQCQKV